MSRSSGKEDEASVGLLEDESQHEPAMDDAREKTGIDPEDLEEEIRRAAEALVSKLDKGRKTMRASERRDRVRDERRRNLLTLASVLLSLACVALTALNLTGTGPFARRAPALSEVQREQLIVGDVIFAVREVEALIDESGEVPSEISSLDFASEPGWSYARVGDAFLLSLSDEGYRVSYDSRLGLDELDVQRSR